MHFQKQRKDRKNKPKAEGFSAYGSVREAKEVPPRDRLLDWSKTDGYCGEECSKQGQKKQPQAIKDLSRSLKDAMNL
nr:hypothetical protein [Tanacetum cinerariifolium]